MIITYIKSQANNRYRFVKNLPITLSSIYCILSGVKDTSLANDGETTGHITTWAVCGVLYDYSLTTVTIGYVRNYTTTFIMILGA